MLEIFLLLVGLFVPLGMMAHRRRRRRSNANFVALPYRALVALGTLGSVTAITNGLNGNNFTEDFQCISVDGTWTVDNWTNVTADGPLTVGYANSDYSVTEIKEALEVNLLGPANMIERERASRRVRAVGTFSEGVGGQVRFMQLNNGMPIRTKLNWLISSGKEINLFAFNEGSGALTTGAIVNVNGKMYGRWRV